MLSWIETHGIEVLIGYFIFIAIQGGMPTPTEASGMAYRWAFRSLGILAASFARLAATEFPNSKVSQLLTGTPESK